MEEHDRLEHDDKGILDTVRRILREDQTRTAEPVPADGAHAPIEAGHADDVLELGPEMMAEPPPAASGRLLDDRRPVPDASVDTAIAPLVNERTEDDTRRSLGSLRSVMREQRAVTTHRGGPSIEDIIRDEMRPLLREWLDTHLPPLVEKLVRSEINRIVERDGT